MNIVLGFLSIVITFSLVLIFEKLFNKEGLFVWISIAVIIANIIVCKNIDILSFTTTLGNVLFASVFLATDIMNEKYGMKESRKAILMGVCAEIVFLISTQMALKFIPSTADMVHTSMETLFSINLRVSIASITMFMLSNLFDVHLYEMIKKKFPKHLWLRNNVSTIVCNCLENYFFHFFAFIGIYSVGTIIEIATVVSVVEIVIAIMDTPFLYLAKYKSQEPKKATN